MMCVFLRLDFLISLDCDSHWLLLFLVANGESDKNPISKKASRKLAFFISLL